MYPYLTIFERMIPTYGVCMALGIAICFLCARRCAVSSGLSTDHLLIISTMAIGCAIFGAKLLYLLISFSPSELMEFFEKADFTALMEGGFVFYGGLLGGILGAWLGAKIAGTPLVRFEQAIVPYLPLGYGIGRIGCFLAGCCYGFSYANLRFPTQLLDAATSFLVCIGLVKYSKKARSPYWLLLLYLNIYAIQRFSIEFFRGDTIRGFFLGLSTSQWISFCLFVFSGIILLHKKRLS